MRMYPKMLLLVVFLCISLTTDLFSQISSDCFISGPIELCVGSTGTYTPSVDSFPQDLFIEFWQITPQGGSQSCPPSTVTNLGNGLLITWECPGVYLLEIGAFTDFGNFYDCLLTVTVTDSYTLPILSSATTACPANQNQGAPLPPGVCEKVCAYSTVTYTVPNTNPDDSTGLDLVWEILGAEDYTIDGNTVTVEWGAPGEGEVIVYEATTDSAGWWIECGVLDIITDPNGGVLGVGFVGVEGQVEATDQFSVELVGPNGYINTGLIMGSSQEDFYELFPGTYVATVTDLSSGLSQTCTFAVPDNPDCPLAIFLEVENASNCDACDGLLFPVVTGGSPPYSFLWSTGSTSAGIENLCPGTYSLTITDSQGCSVTISGTVGCNVPTCTGYGALCVDIIENPEAAISSIPEAVNGEVEICKGQTVFFDNETIGGDTYIWNFDVLGSSSNPTPSFTFNDPGSYEVSLVARNECYCSDTTFLTINVLDAESPEINCTGTVCEGEIATYSTDADCGTFLWIISPEGVILEGGGPADNFVTVQWTEGPEGSVSLQVDNCSSGTICQDPVQELIPIISEDAQIEGPDEVCRGEIAEYRITDFGGAGLSWEISDYGEILYSQGNVISVRWSELFVPNEQLWVAVEFENCYLGCGGRDTLFINMRSEFYLEGPIEACVGEPGPFNAWDVEGPAAPCNWEVFAPDGSLQTTISNQAATTIDWNSGSGRYTIVATAANPGDFCKDSYTTFVNVQSAPPPATAIVGPDSICPGVVYSYEVLGNGPGYDFIWEIDNGGTLTTKGGKKINVIWGNTPPYVLGVAQKSNGPLGCSSDFIYRQVNALDAVGLDGPQSLCPEETAVYTATYYENLDYNWSITPSDAGTIIEGAGNNEVTILWHRSGTADLRVDVCSVFEEIPVMINPLPVPVVDHPSGLCPDAMAEVSTTQPFASYSWTDTSGNVISTLPNPDLSAGYYLLEVEDANGCSSDTSFFIDAFPRPQISIDVPLYLGVCLGGPDLTITALTNTGGYDYQWFQDGNPVGTNSAQFNTNQPGIYQVQITDQNGCVEDSKLLELEDCEALGGICINGICLAGVCSGNNNGSSCTPLGDPDFQIATTGDCNTHDFINTSTNAIPGTFNWEFGDPASGGNNFSNLENPTHTFEGGPGFYPVLMFADFPDANNPNEVCTFGIIKNDTIPAVADFETEGGCPGEPVAFFDNSSFLPFTNISSWQWDFGDPASGADNNSADQNPTHIFSSPGEYMVTLAIIEANGCQVSVTRPVTVFAPPSVTFDPPLAQCENTALPFLAQLSADATSLEWDFGEPASGAANRSELENSFHAFQGTGNYTVSLSAENIYGCEATYSEVISIAPNTLSGLIDALPSSPLCEGDSSILSAPAGGVLWDWSTGEVTETIKVLEEDVYALTLTDADGCTYSPPALSLEIIPAPNGTIQAVEYNDFGLPANYFYGSYAICEGEDVFLEVVSEGSNFYQWSTGQSGQEIEFSEERDNQLVTGTYTYTVTITDISTGCTAVEGPFQVEVHPNPAEAQISATPAPLICEGTLTTFEVDNPDPMNTYIWNTGQSGPQITGSTAGKYQVRTFNQFGCSSESLPLYINALPDVGRIPSGCYARCNPDTICLPSLPAGMMYQWYQDGAPIPAPEGQVPDFIATQSGEYVLELTNFFGCVATSDPLVLDLFDAFGSITGFVYDDVNKNGSIDGADTLIAGIPLILVDGGAPIDTIFTGPGGGYGFPNIPSQDYQIIIDSLNLPPSYFNVIGNLSAQLNGCDDQDQANGLVVESCLASFATLELSACEGSAATYDGNSIPAGESQDFIFLKPDGCDSTLTVNVIELPRDSSGLELFACGSDPVNYNGVDYLPGDEVELFFINDYGCDSIISLEVTGVPVEMTDLKLFACEDGFAVYNGDQLPPGTNTQYLYNSQFGCDSIVQVDVVPLPVDSMGLSFNACAGETVNYNGTDIPAGTQMDFSFNNQYGCDSVVTVQVQAFSPAFDTLQFESCPGEPVVYNGQSILPGDHFDFLFSNVIGGVCDSILTIVVDPLPQDNLTINLSACENTTIDYNGVPLNPGTQTDFSFTNQLGCDSIVTVAVASLDTDASDLTLYACEDEFVEYNGQPLLPNTVTDFTFTNVVGCDSVVTVTVEEAEDAAVSLVIQGCEDGSITYNGTSIAVGDEAEFTFSNQFGCDSVVTVFAVPYPENGSSLSLFACEGGFVDYNGDQLAAGSVQEYVYMDQNGCDSTVMVTVNTWPAFSYSAEEESSSCWNQPTGSILVSEVVGGQPPFAYYLNGDPVGLDSLVEELPFGAYTIGVEDSNGCLYEEDVWIEETPPIILRTDPMALPCDLQRVELSPIEQPFGGAGVEVFWEDGTMDIEYEATEPGLYTFLATNACETLTGTIEVRPAADSLESLVFIPNVFSPNSDGSNDEFKLGTVRNAEILEVELMVFDRWGELHFQTTSWNDSWDGRLRDKRTLPGVYVWHLRVKARYCGQEYEFFEKGDVTVVR
jgi:gliding motility-associated-like protein